MFSANKIDDFHFLLNELNINLDRIAITESCIRENVPCPINIQLSNYSIEDTHQSFNNALSHKPKADLKMYAPSKLESVFIEVICPNSSNLIIGCIYKHPMLHIDDFNNNNISPLFLQKLSKQSSK